MATDTRAILQKKQNAGVCPFCFSDWIGADADTEVHIIPDALAEAPIALCGRSADMCGDAETLDGAALLPSERLCAKCLALTPGGREALDGGSDAPEFTEALIRMRDAENAERNRIICAECGNRFDGDAYGRGCICKQGADALAYLADVGSRRARRAMDGARGGE